MAWQELGERIRELREKRGLTRQALAQAAGLSTVYLKKIEAGERTSPSFEALEAVARALGATLHVEIKPKGRGGRHGR